MKVRQVAPGSLKPHPRNVRQGDVGAIMASIEAFDFTQPIVVQSATPDGEERGYIVIGKHRWLAAQELGRKRVPVVERVLTDDQAIQLVLADNRTHDLGHDDPDALARLLQELGNADLLIPTGWDGDDVDALLRDTGILASDTASFLDQAAKGAPQDDTPRDGPHGWVTLSFTMKPEDRDTVLKAVRLVQERDELDTQPDALVAIAEDVLA